MKIKVTPKVLNSTFFTSLLEFRPDLKNVPFPEQYVSSYTHYKNYINNDDNNGVEKCTLQDYKQFKQQFELCHYLDDKQYLQYCMSQYLNFIYTANCWVIDCNHSKQDKHVMKNKIKQLFDGMVSCHEEFMQMLNDNVQYDIKLLLPYFLLPENISDVLFDTWLHLNHNKRYVYENGITFHHISKLQTVDGDKQLLKMFKTGYSLQPLITYQDHGMCYEWDTVHDTKTIGYYVLGIRHGLTRTWHSGLLRQEIKHVNGKVKHHKCWHPNGNLATCVEFHGDHNDYSEGLLETFYEDSKPCSDGYISYKHYAEYVNTIFINTIM